MLDVLEQGHTEVIGNFARTLKPVLLVKMHRRAAFTDRLKPQCQKVGLRETACPAPIFTVPFDLPPVLGPVSHLKLSR